MDCLWSAPAHNHLTGQTETIRLDRLSLEQLPQVLRLQQAVMISLADPQLFVGLTELELMTLLGPDGLVIGASADRGLIGFCGAWFPGLHSDNLGYSLGLAPEELTAVMHLEGICLHPDFRGNGLWQPMTRLLLELGPASRPVHWICATVSPGNYPSLRTLFAFRLAIRGLAVKYGHYLRYICCRCLIQDEAVDPAGLTAVDHLDLARQRQYLDQGYIGLALLPSATGWAIQFGRLKQTATGEQT